MVVNFFNYIIPIILQKFLYYINFTSNKLIHLHIFINHYVLPVITCLKFSSIFQFGNLVELTFIDKIELIPRKFELHIIFSSVVYNFRLILSCLNNNLGFFSLSNIFSNSIWSEREAKEMFGCYFLGLRDARRLLTDYGFEGFCLRKDFPLSGYLEIRYDDESSTILIEPLELTQDYRLFITKSVWEPNF